MEKEIVDDINIESVEGFDLIEEDLIVGTFLVPVYKADKTIENETFSAVAHLNKDILRNAQKESSAPIVNGSVQVVLFNKALAERGVIELMDGLQRDSSIGTGLFVAVVDGPSKEILEENLGARGTGEYIYDLIEHNMDRRDVPKINMHIFLSDYLEKGKDANLPVLKKTENKVEIIGVAVLKGDKYEMLIPNSQLFYFKMLVDKHTDGSAAFKVPNKEEYVSVKSISSDRKFKVKWKNGMPYINIHVEVDGALREFTGNKVTPEKLLEFEKLFEEKIIAESESMIQEFKQRGVDPVGLGYEVKSRTRGFDYKKWKDQLYPEVNVTVTAKVRIISTGITE
ncbi:Ger(x)C family spore germination protein [Sutcliffiella rhizosphaerae]|uniref:Ger(x)C family spore germination protein n=1 Tax=Sutcliffiella rhizosphaerae TaxID=2880967 RepID=UPI001E4FBC83|nr:Ger(x)C family spore germination protein [Sutcliffiella rhizosphaerae]